MFAVAVALVAALASLAGIDLVLGGDAHLTRSLLDAGGAKELAAVAGVLANDSGAIFLVLGGITLGASLAFVSAQAPGTNDAWARSDAGRGSVRAAR